MNSNRIYWRGVVSAVVGRLRFAPNGSHGLRRTMLTAALFASLVGHPAAAAVSVAVAPSAAVVMVGVGRELFSSNIVTSGTTTVVWKVNGVVGGSATTGTISTAGMYAAPGKLPSPVTVTISAVSSADQTQSASASVTVEPAGTIKVSPAGANVQLAGGTRRFGAKYMDNTDASATWAINGIAGGNATVGTISSTGVYTAPRSMPSNPVVTVTATLKSNTAIHASAEITVVSPTSVSVAVSPSLATVNASGGSEQFTATVQGAAGTIAWKVNGTSGGSSTVGTISSGGMYLAPASVPSPAAVTVTAVSTVDTSKSASATVTIVTSAILPSISGTPATTATVGTAYSFTPTATGASGVTFRFSVANPPAWATFNTATGRLSGTPTAAAVGTYANITISVSDGTNTATLKPFTITVSAAASGSATLSWKAPTTRTDGSGLTNLAGFNLYYGNSTGNYPYTVKLASPTAISDVISGLASGTWYFVATAYDASGNESAQSNVASKTIP